MKLIPKKKTMLSALGFFLASFFSQIALAIEPPPAPPGVPTSDLPDMITRISGIVLGIVGGIAVLFLIIGGFQYITSAGNPDQAGKAKTTIMYAIIGLVVCILSYIIVSFVAKSLR